MRRALGAVPAFAAALLLAILPACGFPRWMYPSTVEYAGPIENPHIAERVAPRDPELPARIERQAGEFCPPAPAGELWFLFLFYGIFYLGYAIGWCFVELVNLIGDACSKHSPDEDAHEPAPEEDPDDDS